MSAQPSTAYYAHCDSAIGPLLVVGDAGRLMAIRLHVEAADLGRAIEDVHHELRGRYVLERDDERMAPVVEQVVAYVSGTRTTFDVALDLSHMTPFQQRVLLETARIPRGETATYAEIARRAGRPGAFRAVGNTMRINPIPIVIPCHRVVASDGIGGYGGRIETKRQLLALEGVTRF